MTTALPHPVAIIGAGFAGIGLAIRLEQLGIPFVVLERSARLGGVWRDNVYPGVACDVPAHLYSYSFEPNPSWSRFFAPQREILAYLERCVDRYGIRSKIRFGCEVTSATWDEALGRWTLAMAGGPAIEARAVVSAAGIALSRPVLPAIPGLGAFAGALFHSARWDSSVDLDGKSVAVIGTGASSIQIVPELARQAARLHVFQRSAPWIVERPDAPISARTQRVFRRWPIVQKAARAAIYLYMERLGAGFVAPTGGLRRRARSSLRFLEASIGDPELRAKCVPNYAFGCKRVLVSSDWYPALCRPNVELVTDRIDEVREHAIVTAGGKVRAVDAIVCATGFEAAEATLPFDVRGRGGRSMTDAAKAGLRAYLGTTVSGFPNFFFIIGPNTALAHNSMIFMMESQYPYVIGALRELTAGAVTSLDVKEDRVKTYNDAIQARLERRVWSTGGCSSWYRTAAGINTTLWPGFTWEYRLRTRRFDIESYDRT